MKITQTIFQRNQSLAQPNQEQKLISTQEKTKPEESAQAHEDHSSAQNHSKSSSIISDLEKMNNLSRARLQKAVKNLQEAPKGITTIDLTQAISVETKSDKKKKTTTTLNGDPELARILTRAMPAQILQAANKIERNGQALPLDQQQSIILHKTGTKDAGLKAILRQTDGSIAVLTHTQSLPIVNSKEANHSAMIMQDGTAFLKSLDKKNNVHRRVDLPTSTHINVLNNVHEAGDGRLLKLIGNRVHQFNQADKAWQPTANGNNVQQLLNLKTAVKPAN